MTPTKEQAVEMYRRMVRIRLFEEAVVERRAEVPGAFHTSVGMEASVVGACYALRRDDYMVGTHRSHGHPIGKGADVSRLVAELLGKATGTNGGKGGSMHLSDFSVGSLGETSIVGSGLPVATGAALGAKMQGLDRVALCFFGDGAAAEGTFHESLNLASIWQLPVVFLCENNAYGQLSALADVCPVRDISMRASAYSIPGCTIDGQDVVAVYEAASEAVERARSGGGPSLIETKTYRYHGHAGGPDVEGFDLADTLTTPIYRTAKEVDDWMKRDPITLFGEKLVSDEMLEAVELDTIASEERSRIDAAWEFARSSPYPDPEAAFEHLYTNPISIAR